MVNITNAGLPPRDRVNGQVRTRLSGMEAEVNALAFIG